MRIINGDCLLEIKNLPDNSVDSIVTDPPYGLSFMGKKWDHDVPSVAIWQECLRVLRPGGHLLAFAGTRTQHRMAVRIEDAGFEIRDMIAWVYGSGFPKSLDVSKAIDKNAGFWRGKSGEVTSENGAMSGGNYERTPKGDPVTAAAAAWEGWGTALKPALEPITVARKPLIGTVAENVLTHGTGALNIDGCRVGTEITKTNGCDTGGDNDLYRENLRTPGYIGKEHTGRWPANLIHDGSEEVTGLFPGQDDKSNCRFFYMAKAGRKERYSFLTCNCETVKSCIWEKQGLSQKDKTDSTLPQVDICEETSTDACACNTSSSGNLQTEQSRQDTKFTTSTETGGTMTLETSNSYPQSNISESMEDAKSETGNGGNLVKYAGENFHSMPQTSIFHQKDGRFMGVVAGATSPLSSWIRRCAGCGCEVRKVGHPTQKPETLMRYLCKLVTRPGGTVLDPFMGSGSTGKAAKLEGFEFIGIELDPEYCKIAESRIASA